MALPGRAQAAEPFSLPPLPWAENALEPYISARTIKFHYGKHHAGYVKNLNAAIKGTPWAKMDLVAIIKGSYGKDDYLFNNAAQVWNHTFYWNSLKPGGGGKPTGELAQAMTSPVRLGGRLRQATGLAPRPSASVRAGAGCA